MIRVGDIVKLIKEDEYTQMLSVPINSIGVVKSIDTTYYDPIIEVRFANSTVHCEPNQLKKGHYIWVDDEE